MITSKTPTTDPMIPTVTTTTLFSDLFSPYDPDNPVIVDDVISSVFNVIDSLTVDSIVVFECVVIVIVANSVVIRGLADSVVVCDVVDSVICVDADSVVVCGVVVDSVVV